jgi:aspartyl-tRNA(Asn)/glutamyl-tRNA(Gln) amidotransferase subunit C
MKLEENTIIRVAEVARLNLGPQEAARFSKDLENILTAFKKLDKAKTEGVEPAFQPVQVQNVFRDDEAGPGLPLTDALANARNKENGQFRGPKVV